MAKETTKNWSRVWVIWIDSAKFRQPWWSYEDFAKESKSPAEMWSCGYKFHEDKNFVYLATSLQWEDGKVVMFGNITSIPKGCIKKIVRA